MAEGTPTPNTAAMLAFSGMPTLGEKVMTGSRPIRSSTITK